MSPTRARIVRATSVLVLALIAGAWLLWPSDDGRADLRAVPPVSTTLPVRPPPSTTATTASVPTTTATPPVGIEPTRLRVPAIGVDARIVSVGLAADGQMEIPAAEDVGWYRLGPRPGDPGSAVVAAHIDFGGRPGAFFDLAELPVGAEVLVEGPGDVRRFVVTEREQVAKAEVQLADHFTAEGPTRLTLITCGGAFSRSVGHYEDNLIITAEPVP